MKTLAIITLVCAGAAIAAAGFVLWNSGNAENAGTAAPHPEAGPLETASWETMKNDVQGIEFRYPATLGTRYIGTHEWPPVVAKHDGGFLCAEGETTVDGLPTKRSAEVVNGTNYCIEQRNEGAAGTMYSSYRFVVFKDGVFITLSFTLRYSQCANYDEVGRSECEKERSAFALNELVDRIAGTAVLR